MAKIANFTIEWYRVASEQEAAELLKNGKVDVTILNTDEKIPVPGLDTRLLFSGIIMS